MRLSYCWYGGRKTICRCLFFPLTSEWAYGVKLKSGPHACQQTPFLAQPPLWTHCKWSLQTCGSRASFDVSLHFRTLISQYPHWVHLILLCSDFKYHMEIQITMNCLHRLFLEIPSCFLPTWISSSQQNNIVGTSPWMWGYPRFNRFASFMSDSTSAK